MNSSLNNSKNERKNNDDDDTLYDKLKIDFSTYNYLFLDLNEFIDMSHFNVGLADILNFITQIDKIHKELSFCFLFPNISSNINLLNIDSLN